MRSNFTYRPYGMPSYLFALIVASVITMVFVALDVVEHAKGAGNIVIILMTFLIWGWLSFVMFCHPVYIHEDYIYIHHFVPPFRRKISIETISTLTPLNAPLASIWIEGVIITYNGNKKDSIVVSNALSFCQACQKINPQIKLS